MMNTYVMHVTETVESRCVIRSKRRLRYEELEKRAEKLRVEGKLQLLAVSDVEMFCEEAKPGGSDAIAR